MGTNKINGQLFKVWKQAPKIINEEGFEYVFLPYFSEAEKARAYNGIKNDKGETWTMYKLEDNLIQVITKVEKKNTFQPECVEEDNQIEWKEDEKQEFGDTTNDYLLNATHTFATVRIVLNMFLRALQRIDKSTQWADFRWKKNRRLIIKVGEEVNVKEYSYTEHTISFGKEYEKNIQIPLSPNFRYTCRSFDLLAHEVGHAILYTLRPNLQNRAFHEAFGDLTAMFALLSRMDVCERLIVSTQGNLTAENNFLMLFDEYYLRSENEHLLGNSTPERERNITPTKQVMQGSPSMYLYMASLEISTAVFVCMVEAFYSHKDIKAYDPAESLFRVGRQILDIFLAALLNADLKKLNTAPFMWEELKTQMKEAVIRLFPTEQAYSEQLQDIVNRVIAPTMERKQAQHLSS